MSVHPVARAMLEAMPWLRLGKANMAEQGRYYRRHRVALLRRGLTSAEWSCTVVHEGIHAERDDGPCVTPWHEAKQERAVEDEAARRLITLDALIDALMWTNDDRELAEELDVDLPTMRTRLSRLTETETAEINARLDDAERWIA